MPITSWESLKDDPILAQLRSLSVQVAELARTAKIDLSNFPTLVDLDWLDRVLQRASSTFTIIVIGQVSSGKSSFINSLLGRRLLLPSDRPTDGVVSVLLAARPHEPEYAEKVLSTGEVERFATMDDATKFLRQQDTSAEQQLQCREVRLHLKEPWLRHLRIVNTPGLGDRLQAFEKAALQYLHEDESDLVVWTFFPEAAANSAEVGHFSDALARRCGAVIGVVTRCLEGKDGDEDYEPKLDSSLVGGNGVGPWLRMNLGKYLQDVIFYDSHVTRRLVQRMRESPDLQSDSTFLAGLERSGYSSFQRILSNQLGEDKERVQEARVASVLKRCRGHAVSIASAAEAAEQAYLQQAEAEKEQIAAWQKMEKNVIGPSRVRFKEEVRALAQERSKELVALMGNSSVDAINENFKLLSTLGRSLVSWTGLCDSAADALHGKISDAVDKTIAHARFYERLDEAMQLLTKEHLLSLENDLRLAKQQAEIGGSETTVSIDSGRPAGGASDVLGDALSGAIKGVISALLKSLAKKLEEQAGKEAAKKATEEVTKQAAKKASEEAAKQAAQQGAGAAAARIAGVITLVLVPFDISKLIKDFKKGRESLAEIVRSRYQADRPIYDSRIFDVLWPMADKALSMVLTDARANLDGHKGERSKYFEMAQQSASARHSLNDLAERLMERTHG